MKTEKKIIENLFLFLKFCYGLKCVLKKDKIMVKNSEKTSTIFKNQMLIEQGLKFTRYNLYKVDMQKPMFIKEGLQG